jgi:hypothetical protein
MSEIIRPPNTLNVNADSVDLSKSPTFVKVVPVKARQMKVDFWITGESGPELGHAGDWLLEGVSGTRWICTDSLFKSIYRQTKPEDLPPGTLPAPPPPQSDPGNA